MMYVPGGERISATAKAKVRKGSLLNADMFRRLLNCSQVPDIARILKSTYYADYLPADVETLRRDELELHLMDAMRSDVRSFFSSMGLKRCNFLRLWFERWDIQLIKGRVWEISTGKTDLNVKTEGNKNSPPSDSSLLFDKRKLLSSNSIDEIIASIKNEKLVTYMEESMKRPVGRISLALAIGFALDMFQNNRVFDTVHCFSGEEREGLLSLIGIYMDIMNITSVYRGKKYFNASDEIALSLAFYTRYRVNFEMLKTIASLPPERMWEPLAGTQYASLLPSEGSESDEISSVAGITRRMRFIQRANALKVFRMGGVGAHFVIAYLILRELEILSLSATIEIVRYNYDRNKAEKLLALSSNF